MINNITSSLGAAIVSLSGALKKKENQDSTNNAKKSSSEEFVKSGVEVTSKPSTNGKQAIVYTKSGSIVLDKSIIVDGKIVKKFKYEYKDVKYKPLVTPNPTSTTEIKYDDKERPISEVTTSPRGEVVSKKEITHYGDHRVEVFEKYDNKKRVVFKKMKNCGSVVEEKYSYSKNGDKDVETIDRKLKYGDFTRNTKVVVTKINGRVKSSVTYDDKNKKIEATKILSIKLPGGNAELHETEMYQDGEVIEKTTSQYDNGKRVFFKRDNIWGNRSYKARNHLDENGSGVIDAKEYYRDSSSKEKLLYREMQNFKNGKLISAYKFDDKGKLVHKVSYKYKNNSFYETIKYPDGRTKEINNFCKCGCRMTHSFDESGKPLITTRYGPMGSTEKWMYAKSGRPLKEEFGIFSGEGPDYLYDLCGKPTKKPDKSVVDPRLAVCFKDEAGLGNDLNTVERVDAFLDLVENNYTLKISEKTKKALYTISNMEKIFKLEEKHEVSISGNYPELRGFTITKSSRERLRKQVIELEKELLKYPPDFFKGRGLEIYLVGNLKIVGSKSNLAIVTGVQPGKGLYLDKVADGTFDHELYHFLERNYNSGGLSGNNKDWQSPFNDGYKGNKGQEWYDSLDLSRVNLPIGFNYPYSMTNPDEHQANMAEDMLSNHVSDVNRRLKGHLDHQRIMSSLRDKIILEYRLWSNGKMDNRYFDDFRNKVRTEWREKEWNEYWKSK